MSKSNKTLIKSILHSKTTSKQSSEKFKKYFSKLLLSSFLSKEYRVFMSFQKENYPAETEDKF